MQQHLSVESDRSTAVCREDSAFVVKYIFKSEIFHLIFRAGDFFIPLYLLFCVLEAVEENIVLIFFGWDIKITPTALGQAKASVSHVASFALRAPGHDNPFGHTCCPGRIERKPLPNNEACRHLDLLLLVPLIFLHHFHLFLYI